MATPSPVAVTIRLDHRAPYAMFELVSLTAKDLQLRGPLMLELGEHVALRLTQDSRHVDVEGKIASIVRGDGHADPVTTIAFDLAAASAVATLLPR